MNPHGYTTPVVQSYWGRQAQIDHWSTLEAALLRELVPEVPLLKPRIPAEEVDALEAHTGHEVGAFLEAFEARLEHPEHKRWLHYGLTSSDLVDSGRQITLHLTTNRLHSAACALLRTVTKLPEVPVVGRTHGQPASPTSYRHRWVVALNAASDLLAWTYDEKPFVMLSGAVGRHRVLSEDLALRVARSVSGRLARGTTQVMPANLTIRHLNLWQGLVLAMEQIALDLRFGAMMDEARPQIHKVGSTAMPGKVNPIKVERICGLAKLWRGYYSAVIESRALWLDRDLHHSSIDRVALAELAGLAHYMVTELIEAIERVDLRATYAPPGLDLPAAVNADALLAISTWAYRAPRAAIYEKVTEVVRKPGATTRDALARVASWYGKHLPASSEWDGDLASLTRRYVACYGGNRDERTPDDGHQDY